MRDIGGGKPLWTVVDVRYGHSTGWHLIIEIERNGAAAQIVFRQISSFRVHDEGEIVDYWGARDHEKVAVGTIYTIDESLYRSELQVGGVSGWTGLLTHYLIAGDDTCVEVLTDTLPTVLLTTSATEE